MIELAFLVLLNRLTNWGRAPVIATRAIAADASKLLALVSDPAGERRIIDGIGLRLRPHAHVEPSRSERVVSVRVTLGRRDLLWITWILTPRRGTTEVDLAAQLESRAVLARLAMVLGGRRWLLHRLEDTLGALAALAHCAAEDLGDVKRDAGVSPRSRTGVAATAPRVRSSMPTHARGALTQHARRPSGRLDRKASVGEHGA